MTALPSKKKADRLNVEITDPVAAAIVKVDQALDALDKEIGIAVRTEERSRPKEPAHV